MLVFYLAALETVEQKNKFEEIYHRYSDFMYKIAYSITKEPLSAEDAVHETFLQIINEIDTLRINNEKELKSYLYILTRERTVDFLRKWERRRGVVQDIESVSIEEYAQEPEQIVFTRMQLNLALSILSEMPEMYKHALVLRVKGYTIKEIAHITNTTQANVKTRIFRARKAILKEFG